MVKRPQIMDPNAGHRKPCGQMRAHGFDSFAQPSTNSDEASRVRSRHAVAGGITPRDDRRPVPGLVKGLQGKVFGDRGYISQILFADLFPRGVQLITTLRKDMKNKLLFLWDKLLLRKRSLIETINDQLTNITPIEHLRHRSVANFLVNLVAGLIAYTHREKKPSLHLRIPQAADLSVLAL